MVWLAQVGGLRIDPWSGAPLLCGNRAQKKPQMLRVWLARVGGLSEALVGPPKMVPF